MCLISAVMAVRRALSGRSGRGLLMSAATMREPTVARCLATDGAGRGARSFLRRGRIAQPSAVRQSDRDRSRAAGRDDRAIGGRQNHPAHPVSERCARCSKAGSRCSGKDLSAIGRRELVASAAQCRLYLPDAQFFRRAVGLRKRQDGDAAPAIVPWPRCASAVALSSIVSGSETGSTTSRGLYRGASASASPSPAHW